MELIFFLGFVLISLLGWGVASVHSRFLAYNPSATEQKAEEEALNVMISNGKEEAGLREILMSNSIKGFKP